MSAPSPEKMREWLLERMSSSELFSYIPDQIRELMVERGAGLLPGNDGLDLRGILVWLKSEYDVAPDKTLDFFSALAHEAEKMGFRLDWKPPEWSFEKLPPDLAPKKPKPKHKVPAPLDYKRQLYAFLNDAAYLESVALDHILDGGHDVPDPLNRSIIRLLPTKEETALLSTATLDPGGTGGAPADWVLRLMGLTLAANFAVDLTVSHAEFNQEQWKQAAGEFLEHMDGLRYMAGQQINKAADAIAAKAIGDSLARLEKSAGELSRAREQSSRAPQGSASRNQREAIEDDKPEPKTEPGSWRGIINRNPLIVGPVLVAILAAAVFYSIFFSHPPVEDFEAVFENLPFEVKTVQTQGDIMIVRVDEARWSELDDQLKLEGLSSIHSKAHEHGLVYVQVRGPENKILAVYSGSEFLQFP